MNFENMTIRTKLYLSYGLMTALAVVLGVTSIVILRGLAATTQDVSEVRGGRMFLAGEIRVATTEQLSLARGIYIREEAKQPDVVEKYVAQYAKDGELINQDISALRVLAVGDEKRLTALDAMQAVAAETETPVREFLAAIHADDMATALKVYQATLVPSLQVLAVNANDIVTLARTNMQKGGATAEADVQRAIWSMTVLMVVGFAIGGVIVFVIRNLDATLRQNVIELNENSEQVASAAGQVSTSSQSLAREASEQAAMIEQTSASTEEINSMAKRNSESAQNATTLVEEAVRSTDATNQAMGECVEAMGAIGDSSNKIAKTLQVIDNIAFQTNILALNAAVEAARAGEAGMGFAVVAEEVRNLAQRCAEAARETSELVELSLSNSNGGSQKIGQLVESSAKVTEVFARMRVLIDQIARGSEEQGSGIRQIGQAITKMEQGTQQSAANAEESAAAAEELNAQSDALRGVASSLGRMVGHVRVSQSRQSTGATPRRKTSPRPAPVKLASKKPMTSFSSTTKLSGQRTATGVAKPVAARVAVPAGAGPFPMDDDDFLAF